MTTVDRNLVIVLITLLALVMIATGFAGAGSQIVGAAIFIFILVEVVVYFIAAMVMNAKATIPMAAGSAVVFTMLRAICSILGAILFQVFNSPTSADFSILHAWVNPVSGILQIATLILTGPFLLAMSIPDLVGDEAAAAIRGEGAAKASRGNIGPGLDTSPSGGFVQVFSYEELSSLIKKSHGIEGFVLYSHEGLVVWQELPLRLDIDVLTARVLNNSIQMGHMMQESGLTKVRRVMIEAKEHSLFSTTLNHNFGMILLFSNRVPPEEIFGRIAILAKSTREFLQWKYPGLPLAVGLNKDKMSLEIL